MKRLQEYTEEEEKHLYETLSQTYKSLHTDSYTELYNTIEQILYDYKETPEWFDFTIEESECNDDEDYLKDILVNQMERWANL